MNHKPISLGFAALSAMTLMVGCSVDSGRIDKDVATTKLKMRCNSPNALNMAAINENRNKTIAANTAVKIQSAVKKNGVSIDNTVDASDVEDENIDVVMNCDNLTADLKLPLSIVTGKPASLVSTKIKGIDTNKIELEDAEGNKYAIEVSGVETIDSSNRIVPVAMTEMDKEDGLNQVKLTVTDIDGVQLVYTSESAD